MLSEGETAHANAQHDDYHKWAFLSLKLRLSLVVDETINPLSQIFYVKYLSLHSTQR